MQNKKLPDLTVALLSRLEGLPPILSIPQLATFLGRKVGTIRQQHRRGVLGLPVREKNGGEQYILLNDLSLYLRGGHEAFENIRKPGRPTNLSKVAEGQIGGGL